MWIGRLRGALFPEERWLATVSAAAVRRPVVVLSSRIGRDLERWSTWLERLNRLLEQLAAGDRTLLTCAGTTAHRYLQPAAAARNIPCMECLLPHPRQTFSQWTRALVGPRPLMSGSRLLAASPAADLVTARPPAGTLRTSLSDLVTPQHWPLADRLLAALGQELYVVFVRRGGNLERLVSHQLAHPPARPQRWLLGDDGKSIPAALAEQWRSRGAVIWEELPRRRGGHQDHLVAPDVRRGDRAVAPLASTNSGRVSRIVPLSDVHCERYLAHWTRCQWGPWPDQSEGDYVQSLLVDASARDRSALATLLRILRMCRLIATNRLTRGPTKVVCFTGRPLTDFVRCRTFRPMHARWDFEPFGVCIDRSWLTRHGARPVIYGDDATWRTLAQGDQPFFQHRGNRSPACAGDWTVEDEWRHVGDVDLNQVPPEQVLVFVPDAALAAHVGVFSPWCVTVVK
jgi:hypothetical protein